MAFRDVQRNLTQGFIGRLSPNKSAALGAYPSIGKSRADPFKKSFYLDPMNSESRGISDL